MADDLATLLEIVADEAGERVAVVHADTRRTWRELDRRAAALARYFADQGLGPGSRIAICLFNGPEYLETVLAVMKLRAVQVNVNYRYRQRELYELLAGSGARALVYDGGLAAVVSEVAARLPGLTTSLRLGGNAADSSSAVDYDQVVARTPELPRAARSGDDPWLMFTGGTTGIEPVSTTADQVRRSPGTSACQP